MLTSSRLYHGDQGFPSPVKMTCASTWQYLLHLLLGFLSNAVLNINLFSFWLLHLYIEFLRKLKAFEPPVSPTYTEEGEDEGRTLRLGKRILRSLAIVFGSMAFASLAYTGILNLIEMTGSYIPVFLYNNQELLITTATSVILYILASYYR
ncbi:hypothetical protein OIU76_016622 [Salix suchowensis]|nr:hypothetical protein OIU76_016622 [Salix suchowensis]